MKKLGIIASAYVTTTALAFATLGMIAGSLDVMCGFSLLSLLGGTAWLILSETKPRTHVCTECEHVLPSHRARYHAGDRAVIMRSR